ncbi:hypothetical protein SAMN02927903_02649 [Flavobacterium caeni]|uniref:Uncharacterized protein n=2 Tax=Flavobacterium caeni TaxID=490189 RepID=A0A1G5JCM9_9FLAO|nr:hypothetical protein SAMN02927903_02649 [Flavobacterium caeni]
MTLLALGLLMGCGTKDGENKPNESQPIEAAPSDEVVFKPMIDPKTNEAYAMMPLPMSWRINQTGAALIESPDGVRVYNLPLRYFVYTDDPYFLQLYSQSGQPVRRFVEIDQLLHEDFLPIADREGSKFVEKMAVPEIAQADRTYDAMLFKVTPSQQQFNAFATEWQDKEGNPYLIVIHQNASYANNLLNWGYYCQAMQAPKAVYEKAKQTLLYGLAHTQYNPKSVEAYNRSEAQKANASMAAHQQRMTALQQNFDQSQRAFESKRDAINASIMANYQNADAASDRSHNRFLNYIKGEETVSAGGQRYQVQGGSNQYWVNQNGEYVGSNDPNYDPNRNQGTENQTWDEAQIER